MKAPRILIVATSHHTLDGSPYRTGLWLEEIAAPYYVFKDAKALLTLASPLGGAVPLEPKSESIILATGNTRKFLKDEEARRFLDESVPLSTINVIDFDLVYLLGGHGCLWDLAQNPLLWQLLQNFYLANKPIGAVSHGVAPLFALLNIQGGLLVKGMQLTCFSNSEEESSGIAKLLPFQVETELSAIGGAFSKRDNYTPHVVEDGNIITGQNPASAEETARKLLMWLKLHPGLPVLESPVAMN